MVEQTSPAPTASPAGGALAPEQGAQAPQGAPVLPEQAPQRPDIMSILSNLTASGQASGSVRTVARR